VRKAYVTAFADYIEILRALTGDPRGMYTPVWGLLSLLEYKALL